MSLVTRSGQSANGPVLFLSANGMAGALTARAKNLILLRTISVSSSDRQQSAKSCRSSLRSEDLRFSRSPGSRAYSEECFSRGASSSPPASPLSPSILAISRPPGSGPARPRCRRSSAVSACGGRSPRHHKRHPPPASTMSPARRAIAHGKSPYGQVPSQPGTRTDPRCGSALGRAGQSDPQGGARPAPGFTRGRVGRDQDRAGGRQAHRPAEARPGEPGPDREHDPRGRREALAGRERRRREGRTALPGATRAMQKQSAMPDGLVANLTPEQLADLIAYLQSLK